MAGGQPRCRWHTSTGDPRGPYGADRLVESLDYATALLEALEAAGLPWLQFHPEYGASQFELSLAPGTPLEAADRLVHAKLLIQRLTRRFGWRCSFSPKPSLERVGNGGHLHLSLRQGGAALLEGGDGEAGLSDAGAGVLAALLEELPALLALACPLPVSYRRLAPGSWSAPFQVWGVENREAALRLVPAAADGAPAHLELKVADLAANPYLLLGAAAAVVGDGLARDRPLPPPVVGDPAGLPAGVVPHLPASLAEASAAFAASDLLRQALGEALHGSLCDSQAEEVRRAEGCSEAELVAAAAWWPLVGGSAERPSAPSWSRRSARHHHPVAPGGLGGIEGAVGAAQAVLQRGQTQPLHRRQAGRKGDAPCRCPGVGHHRRRRLQPLKQDRAASVSTPSSSSANSSPPTRASTSPGRSAPRMALATSRSTASPAAWPQPSLMALKWSMSSMAPTTGRPSRDTAARAALAASVKPVRLGRPVSGSRWAAAASSASSRSRWRRVASAAITWAGMNRSSSTHTQLRQPIGSPGWPSATCSPSSKANTPRASITTAARPARQRRCRGWPGNRDRCSAPRAARAQRMAVAPRSNRKARSAVVTGSGSRSPRGPVLGGRLA